VFWLSGVMVVCVVFVVCGAPLFVNDVLVFCFIGHPLVCCVCLVHSLSWGFVFCFSLCHLLVVLCGLWTLCIALSLLLWVCVSK